MSAAIDKVNDRPIFKPSSLGINEPFESNKNIFGENEKNIKTLINKSLEV
jgi:hypothetical protein